MYNSKPPLCITVPDNDYDEPIYDRRKESDGVGGYVTVDRYPDGSAVTHFGGPCGSVRTDANGDEC